MRIEIRMKVEGNKMEEDQRFQVRFVVLNFTLVFSEDAALPVEKESALRGGIGEMLLRQHCIRDRNCENCSFCSACIVQNFMYAKYQKKPDFVTTGESIGFVIEAEHGKKWYEAGESFRFSLTLFGNTIVYLNPLVQAIYMLGQVGLGEKKAKFQIAAIENRKGEPILYHGAIYYKNYQIETLSDYIQERKETLTNPTTIRFSKPLTIKYRGEFIQQFDIRAIINGATRRIYMLDCYEGIDTEEAKFYEDLPQIKKQSVQQKKVMRHSSRRQQSMEMKGITGKIELDGIREEILDYLLAGEITHIGKNTRFGFGKYELL